MKETSSRILRMAHYFTCKECLLQLFQRRGRQMGFAATNAAATLSWQWRLRAKVSELLGLDKMERGSMEVCVTERVSMPGYWRERIEVETEPGVITVMYVLVPDDLRPGEQRPLMLAPHGHVSAGKSSPAGRRDIPAVAEWIEALNYDYGATFAREGWVVFCPDARGFGERRESHLQGEAEEKFINSSCYYLAHMALPLGLTVAGMMTWDLMRLLDYAQSRGDCDMHRVGCAGLSGGGLQTLYLTALDERVRCAVVSGYFYGVCDALLIHSEHCDCNYIPGLWLSADMGDLGALCAPRPLLIETGDEDALNGPRGLANVTEQVEITHRAYAALGAEDRLRHAIFRGGRRWDGAAAIPWLRKWLGTEGCSG